MYRKSLINQSCVIAFVGMFMLPFGCNVDPVWHASNRAPSETRDADTADRDLATMDGAEVDLVERVVADRESYLQGLRDLRQYYESHGYPRKESWAAFELDGMKHVRKFKYVDDSEVPTAALTAKDSVAEADALYDKGRSLMRKGGAGIPVVYRREKMVEAVSVFRELIERFPSSDKIDDAAFMLGEIHKEYMTNEEPIAVRWYERAWSWDPSTPHPARFQAAVVCDYRLHDRDRALELYHAVLVSEQSHRLNVGHAERRIRELTTPVAERRLSQR